MKPLLREYIQEALYVPNHLRAKPYSMHIFERDYVRNVLGLNIPLNESYPYSPSLERRIIQEQLLMEGFFSDLYQAGKEKLMSAAEGVKKFGKEAWSVLQGFYLAVKDGAGKALASSIAKKSINKFLNPIHAALKWLVAKLPDWNMPTFASMAEKGLNLLNKMKEKLNSVEGWKAVALYSGVAVGMQWLWNKIGDWIDELKEKVGGDFEAAAAGLTEDDDEDGIIKSWVKETAKEALTSLIGGDMMKKIASMASAVTVSGWWKAAKAAGKGAKLVIDALGDATERFVARHTAKLELPGEAQNESYRRETMKITKQQLRRIIKEAMADEPIRQIAGDSFPADVLKARERSKPAPGAFKDTIVMSPTGDSVLVSGMETDVDHDLGARLYELSGVMLPTELEDDLHSMIMKQMADGYVEIPISWSPNTGWKF